MIYSLSYEYLPDGDGGSTKYFLIKITPKYKDDPGIKEHELDHVSLFWTVFITLSIIIGIGGYFYTPIWALLPLAFFAHNDILYRIPWYKKYAEVRAYRVQLRYPPATTDLDRYRGIYAGFLSSKYGLDITKDEALKLLQ